MQIFPNFQRLSLGHKSDVESIWRKFPPYSDFNFTSMYSYNTDESAKVCTLNSNLVIMLPDYMLDKVLLSFLGISDIDETITTLLEYAVVKTGDASLKLVPEVVIENINNKTAFDYREDLNNNDYVISAEEISTLKGGKWHEIRKEIRHFKEEHNYQFQLMDLSSEEIRKQMDDLFNLWVEQKNKTDRDTQTEHKALERSFVFANEPDHFAFGLYIGGKMIGYSTNQIVHNGFYMGHFGKADADFPGAYQIMEHECAKFFIDKGCKFMNYEQDLGIPGLRQAKRSWNPVSYLKKYTIKPKIDK